MHPSRPLKYLRLTGPLPVDETVSTPVHVCIYKAGDWSVVQIDGELDIQAVPAVRPLPPGEDALVVFDLHRTTFMDCSGLRLLAGIARTASPRGGCARVAGASRQVRKLVTLANLDRAVSMFESLEDALTAPTGSGAEVAGKDPGTEPHRAVGGCRPEHHRDSAAKVRHSTVSD
jgi:anti-anti-sigma factor